MNPSSKNSLNFSPQKEPPKRKAFGFLVRLLLEHPLGMTAVILFSVGAAVSELLSIALLMPFLESLRGAKYVAKKCPFTLRLYIKALKVLTGKD